MVDICKYKWCKTLYEEEGKNFSNIKHKKKASETGDLTEYFPLSTTLVCNLLKRMLKFIIFGCCQNTECFKMVISVLECKDAGYFLVWKGKMVNEMWSTLKSKISEEKIISTVTWNTCFARFTLLLVLYYFSSLVSFTGGMSLPFLVNLKENYFFF